MMKKSAAKSNKKNSPSPSLKDKKICFKRSEGVVFRSPNEDEVLAIVLDDPDTFYRMDKWVVDLWNYLDGKTTVAEICEKIQKKSKLPQSFVEKEAEKMLREMEKARLIQKV